MPGERSERKSLYVRPMWFTFLLVIMPTNTRSRCTGVLLYCCTKTKLEAPRHPILADRQTVAHGILCWFDRAVSRMHLRKLARFAEGTRQHRHQQNPCRELLQHEACDMISHMATTNTQVVTLRGVVYQTISYALSMINSLLRGPRQRESSTAVLVRFFLVSPKALFGKWQRVNGKWRVPPCYICVRTLTSLVTASFAIIPTAAESMRLHVACYL